MDKKIEKKKVCDSIGYRPSPEAEKFIEDLQSDSIFSKSQLIELAIRYLMALPEQEMKSVITDLAFGKSLDAILKESQPKLKKGFAA